eukprot:546180-Karenia_brevis.AAC.1
MAIIRPSSSGLADEVDGPCNAAYTSIPVVRRVWSVKLFSEPCGASRRPGHQTAAFDSASLGHLGKLRAPSEKTSGVAVGVSCMYWTGGVA